MASPFALEAREAKRAEAVAIGVDAAFVDLLVERFYAAIRQDELLGPIFASKIVDWPPHLHRMKQFWRSILFSSGEFAGNPMLKHLAIPGLEERHFAHWLTLFYATLRQIERDPAATQLIGGKARMIATSLLVGIAMNRDGIAGGSAGKDLPHV
ncbi:MAG: group III truncated hemoglobin [Erythrobacter sp.]|nr:group III truncated hemoglobin [Erythrobacter sp.]